MRVRTLPLTLAAASLAVAVLLPPARGRADEKTDENKVSGAVSAGPPPWLAGFDATKGQPIGMTEADAKAYLMKQIKSEWVLDPKAKDHPAIWSNVVLLMTPAWKVDVPAFSLSKYEVTNAQWERFLEDRMESYVTQKGDTLEGLSARFFHIANPELAMADVQRGWRAVLARNADALLPVLNPDGDAKWDPLVARAQERSLPEGLRVRFPRYMPPPHWKNGVLPDNERRRPMHYVSWEQAVDFCNWAGLHLPTEFEWERAARGPEGRWFPWGNEWDPLKAIWQGFNAAALTAAREHDKHPETPAPPPPVGRTDSPSDTPKEMPNAVEVDAHPEGATPEGVLHMIGNMAEFTSSKAALYPGSKTGFAFADGTTVVVRGGSFQDRAETLLAADRNAEGPTGTNVPSNAVDNYGFRLASYPVAGADMTLLVAQRYNETLGLDQARNWLPLPAGVKDGDRKEAELYSGFDAQLTAGILERHLVNESPDQVFVTGPATGVAFLPVRGYSQERVKTAAELMKLTGDPDRPVLLGVLVGTGRSGFEVVNDVTDEAGATTRTKTTIAFADPRLDFKPSAPPERLLTSENIGAVLLLEGARVAVYAPNITLNGKAKYREGLLGYLEYIAEVTPAAKDKSGAVGEWRDGIAFLSAAVPWLDRKGQAVNRSSGGVRLTLRVPFVRDVKAAAKK